MRGRRSVWAGLCVGGIGDMCGYVCSLILNCAQEKYDIEVYKSYNKNSSCRKHKRSKTFLQLNSTRILSWYCPCRALRGQGLGSIANAHFRLALWFSKALRPYTKEFEAEYPSLRGDPSIFRFGLHDPPTLV